MPSAAAVPAPCRNWFRPCGASSVVANANPMSSAAIFTKIQSGMRPSDGKVYCAPRNKWRHALEQKWAALHFGEVKVETRGEQHVFEVQVCLNDLDLKAVRVELYADGVMGSAPVRQEMKRVRQLAGASGGYVYSAAVSAARPSADYAARVIPYCDGVVVPLEEARILWQR